MVFVDESGVTLSIARRYGRGPKGERVHGDVPLGHWKATTLIGAPGLEGVRASFTVEGATDTEVLGIFVSEVLLPTLRIGDVVIWDNLPVHKNRSLEVLVEQAGARVLRLPPYSPDFDPIESC